MSSEPDDPDDHFDYETLARLLLPGVIESLGHVRLGSLWILFREISAELSFFTRIEAQRRISELSAVDLALLDEVETRKTFVQILEPLYREIGREVDLATFEIYPDPPTS